MLDLIFLVALAAWSAGLGFWILRWLITPPEHLGDRLALAVPLGMGTLALASLGLGLISHLHATSWIFVLAAGLFPSALGWKHLGVRFKFPTQFAFDFPGTLFDVALGLTLLGTILTATLPVTDGDALCYHLQVPKVFLQNRATVFEPDLHETIYPLVVEMLYAAALTFRGPIVCRGIQWILGVCFAANVTALARPCLGPRARWAGAIALLVPAVSNGMGAPLNDVALAAFGNAALFAFLLYKDQSSVGSATLLGVLTGLAIGTKYPALVWAGLLGFGILVAGRKNLRTTFVHFGIFVATFVVVGGGWYLRAYLSTGNPVFPFFRSIFGGSGLDVVLDPIKRPLAVTPWNLLTALGPMTLQPDRFDSFSHQFGPAFLLFAPAVFLLKMPRRIGIVAAMGFAFLTLCLTQRQSMRFLLTAVGPLSVVVAWAASSWCDRKTWPGRILVGLLAIVLLFEAAIALGRSRNGISLLTGRESEETYLDRREPTYRVGRWIEAHLPANARIIGQEHRGYYLPRPYSMELANRRRTGLGTRGESAGEIIEILRNEGFTHLLLCPPEPEDAVEFDPTLSRLLARWLASHPPLYEQTNVDPDGVRRRYRLYEISSDSVIAVNREAVR